MYINFGFKPYEITKTTRCSINIGSFTDFNVLTIGKDSYITKATVESGLDFDSEIKKHGGVYNLQIGKYCSIAEDVLFMIDINHDYMSVFQGCPSELKDIKLSSRLKRKGQILIENDVWIGHGATIMNGVTIHNGAVVAAGSIVTKDVPAYAIVAGNPARVVKKRYSDDIIEKLLKISWWNWTSSEISKRKSDFADLPEAFVQKYYDSALEKYKSVFAEQNPINNLCNGEKFVITPYFNDKYPLYPKIIKSFCEEFSDKPAQLIIYLSGENYSIEKEFQIISDCLSEYSEYNVFVQIIDRREASVERVLAYTDYYITNRSSENLYYTEIAEKYGKKVLSGVDIPVFDLSR